ncbi:motility-associated ABC transporter substrate-binding family protein [Phycisphaera mikurensis]|uniref:Uncharacterized protein n=1 Tax=Phycisphaera mikurensis (strain NBRC 102666 / KCTC 22515 / FYK2301M01) TaxID=1142394 RepID=I0IE55_PHYMF|nr:hypothetical protein [Phycisphaera mikurensis]MBB6441348.1 hypothetical protein [Phycisphaera mikurensis]BAM03543.1 hypothetical protein PSMK_13840 [Phycisphaera mikurensis NBRC 102666]
MSGASPRPAGRTQRVRRVLYGGNAFVSVAAAVGVALGVVWFAGFVVQRASGPLASVVRLDLTENRRFSLSPRTLAVVGGLDEPVEAVRVGGDPGAADLLRRVARAAGGGRLEVSSVDPVREPAAWEQLLSRVQRLTGGGAVVEAARAAAEAARGVAAGYEEAAGLLAAAASEVQDREAAEKLRSDAATLLARAAGLRASVDAAVDGLEAPLPALARSREPLRVQVQSLLADQLPAMRRYLDARAGDRRAPAAARDAALRAGGVIEAAAGPLEAAAARLADTPVPRDQERALAALSGGAGVVVIRGERVRAFAAGPGDDPATLESRLVASLLNAELDEPPALVWVDSADAPALGQGGAFNAVAGRARDAGFEIAQLRLAPGPLRVQPFEPGRRIVWVVPPIATPDDRDGGPVARLARLLEDRLAAGDGVVLVPGFRNLGRYAAADPLAAVAAAGGIAVREGELVLALAAGEGEGAKPVASPRFEVSFGLDAPAAPAAAGDAGARIRDALGTGVAFLELPQPLELSGPAVPLLTLDRPGLWVEDEPLGSGELGGARPGAADARGPAAVAAAAALPSTGRLAVFGDGLMFRDAVLQRARRSVNADLFAVTCLWAAGLDDAVAAGPATGVGRVVPALGADTRRNLQLALAAGLPALALLAGLGVAWWRRG